LGNLFICVCVMALRLAVLRAPQAGAPRAEHGPGDTMAGFLSHFFSV
jgi:hypothetical protein